MTLWNAAGYWREGLRSLGGGRLDVAVLDAASIAGAIARREWSTAGSVMFLLGLSALLEDYTRKRTQTTLTQSLAIHVDTVWRRTAPRNPSPWAAWLWGSVSGCAPAP